MHTSCMTTWNAFFSLNLGWSFVFCNSQLWCHYTVFVDGTPPLKKIGTMNCPLLQKEGEIKLLFFVRNVLESLHLSCIRKHWQPLASEEDVGSPWQHLMSEALCSGSAGQVRGCALWETFVWLEEYRHTAHGGGRCSSLFQKSFLLFNSEQSMIQKTCFQNVMEKLDFTI